MSEQYVKRIILKFKRIFSFTLKIKFFFMNSLWAEKNMFIYFHSTCMQCAKYFQGIHISLNKFVMLHKKSLFMFSGTQIIFSDFGDNKIYMCMCLVSWSFKCQIEGWNLEVGMCYCWTILLTCNSIKVHCLFFCLFAAFWDKCWWYCVYIQYILCCLNVP